VKRYLCSAPGCYATVSTPRSYCLKHADQAIKKPAPRPWATAKRPNDHLYATPRWRALRKKILEASPACVRCGSTEALSVHHLDPPKGNEEAFFNPEGLAVLCKVCHDKITIAENRQAKNQGFHAAPYGAGRE